MVSTGLIGASLWVMVPRLEATHFERLMDSGRTAPALCGCVDQSGSAVGEYVIKLRGAIEMGNAGLINELLAARLAEHFGLATPGCAVVTIERELIDLIVERHSSRRAALQGSMGLNFGSKHLVGVGTWPVDKPIPEEDRVTAVEVFAFDALLQNPDRQYNNPNLFVRDLTLFDHESAFSFLLAVLPSNEPWDVGQQKYLQNHVFFRRLKSKAVELEDFSASLTEMSDDVIAAIVADVPPEWDNQEWVARIIQHLRAVRDHSAEFADSIRRVLR
jgi:hypothetical protein